MKIEMNILHVIQFFNPKFGGTVNSVYNQSKYLSKKGHEVTIYTTDFNFDDDYARSLTNVRIIPFHCSANAQSFFYTPRMKKQIKKEMKTFDIIHLHNFRTYQNAVVHHFSQIYKVPYVLQPRGDFFIFLEKQRLKKLFDWRWGNSIINHASKLIALNNMEMEQFKQMNIDSSKIEIIPNGIDLSIYNKLPFKKEFRNKYSITDDEKIILYLGRIHKIKGIDILVKAFSRLSCELNNVKLVIVGSDDDFLSILKKNVLNLEIEDKVLFTGPLYGQEKLQAYVDADVFVLPSIYEMFPNTVLEASICGTPVVVTDRCGIADIIDQKIGYVVKYNSEELKKGIFNLLSDERLRRKLGDNGKKLVSEKFDLDIVVDKIENMYNNCLQNLRK